MGRVHTEFDAPGTYRIKVSGYLDPGWTGRLGGMTITTKSNGDKPPVSILYGELADEAALSGVLNTLYDYGYSLQSVKKIALEKKRREK